MNIIEKIGLETKYKELKKYNLNDELLILFLNSKNKKYFKNTIKPFIQYLEDNIFCDNSIEKIITIILKLNDIDSINRYITFIKNEINMRKDRVENFYIFNEEEYKNMFNNYFVFENQKFNEIYPLVGDKIFAQNISEIIQNEYGDKLVKLLEKLPYNINISNWNKEIFNDRVLQIIYDNQTIGEKSIIEIFYDKIEILAEIVNNELYDGFKYTYEHVPESQTFINIFSKSYSLQQFSMDFINKIGIERLKKLYIVGKFENKEEFEKIFEIAELGNFELIKDAIDLDEYFEFKNILKEDLNKNILEIKSRYKKINIFLNKYLGMSTKQLKYFKRFMNSINEIRELPLSYVNKYGDILKLINKLISSSDEEIINISKNSNFLNKNEYKKLLKMCEKEGNEIIKKEFVNELDVKNKQIIENNAIKKTIIEEEKSIDLYEFTGQPFLMLVHGITSDNPFSVYNEIARNIIEKPLKWVDINSGNNYISTSLISDEKMAVYAIPSNSVLMFGFDNFSSENIKIMDCKDLGIERTSENNLEFHMSQKIFDNDLNTIVTPKQLLAKTGLGDELQWNEVILTRIDIKTKEVIKPSYVVCFDTINDLAKKAASCFEIPIYLIHKNCYKKNVNIEKEENRQNTNNRKK